jgi:hypothetical protein
MPSIDHISIYHEINVHVSKTYRVISGFRAPPSTAAVSCPPVRGEVADHCATDALKWLLQDSNGECLAQSRKGNSFLCTSSS